MRNVILGLATAGMTVLASACVTGNGDGLASYASGLSQAATYVEVQNNNWADMDVFVLRYGEGRRLGMVTSMTTERFRVPQSWVNRSEEVAIQVEPIGSSDVFATQAVPLEPGSVLAVTVQNRLVMSHMLIR